MTHRPLPWLLGAWSCAFALASSVGAAQKRADVHGKALAFDGKGSVTLPAAVMREHFNGALTVSLWLKVDKPALAANTRVFHANEHLRNGFWIDLYAHGEHPVAVDIGPREALEQALEPVVVLRARLAPIPCHGGDGDERRGEEDGCAHHCASCAS